MEKQQHSIDEIFRQSLGDYREAPPAAAWDEVVRRLDKDKDRRHLLPWPWVVLSLLMIIGGAWFIVALYGRGNDTDIQQKKSVEKTNKQSQGKGNASTGIVAERKDTTHHTDRPAPSSNAIVSQAVGKTPYARGIRHQADTQASHTQSQLPGSQKSVSIAHNPLNGAADTDRTDKIKQPLAHVPVASNTAVIPKSSSGDITAPGKEAAKNRPEQLPLPAGKGPKDSFATAIVHRDAPATGNKKAIVPKDTAAPLHQSRQPAIGINKPAVPKVHDVDSGPRARVKTAQNTSRPGPYATQEDPAKGATTLNIPATGRTAGVSLNKKPRVVKRTVSGDSMQHRAVSTRQTATVTAGTKKLIKVINPASKAQKRPVTFIRDTSSAIIRQASTGSKSTRPATVAKSPALVPAKSRLIPVESSLNLKKEHPQPEKRIVTASIYTAPAMRALIPAAHFVKIPPAAQPAITRLQSELIIPAAALQVESESTIPAVPLQAQSVNTNAADSPEDSDSIALTAKPKRSTSLSFAALAGYESGIKTPVQQRINAGFRLLWHTGPSLAIGIQPAFRYGSLPSTEFTGRKTYQRSSIDVNTSVIPDISPSIRGQIDTLYNYVVRETFDSIIVNGSSAGGNLWEAELPLIFHYKLFRSGWHVYGGPSLNFGGRLTITPGTTQTYTTIRKDSLVESTQMSAAQFADYFGRSSLERYSNYKPSDHSLYDPATVRLGYLAGLGYEGKRFLFDACIRQQLSGYKDMAPALQQVYAAPYLRLSVGYFLFPPRAAHKNPEQ